MFTPICERLAQIIETIDWEDISFCSPEYNYSRQVDNSRYINTYILNITNDKITIEYRSFNSPHFPVEARAELDIMEGIDNAGYVEWFIFDLDERNNITFKEWKPTN